MTNTPPPDVAAIAEREVQAVWRCAIGDVTAALDALQNRLITSKRKSEREAGAALKPICDLIWASRDPAPKSYNGANEAGKVLRQRVSHHLEQNNG